MRLSRVVTSPDKYVVGVLPETFQKNSGDVEMKNPKSSTNLQIFSRYQPAIPKGRYSETAKLASLALPSTRTMVYPRFGIVDLRNSGPNPFSLSRIEFESLKMRKFRSANSNRFPILRWLYLYCFQSYNPYPIQTSDSSDKKHLGQVIARTSDISDK